MKKTFLFSMMVSTLAMGSALAADAGMHDKDQVVFDAATNTLKIPKVQLVDADGNMTDIYYTAEMDISKNVAGEKIEFRVNDLKQTDDHGCVLPETWHGEMGHCMNQN